MTNKTVERKTAEGRSADTFETAQRIHTLTQMILAEVSLIHPWVNQVPMQPWNTREMVYPQGPSWW